MKKGTLKRARNKEWGEIDVYGKEHRRRNGYKKPQPQTALRSVSALEDESSSCFKPAPVRDGEAEACQPVIS